MHSYVDCLFMCVSDKHNTAVSSGDHLLFFQLEAELTKIYKNRGNQKALEKLLGPHMPDLILAMSNMLPKADKDVLDDLINAKKKQEVVSKLFQVIATHCLWPVLGLALRRLDRVRGTKLEETVWGQFFPRLIDEVEELLYDYPK